MRCNQATSRHGARGLRARPARIGPARSRRAGRLRRRAGAGSGRGAGGRGRNEPANLVAVLRTLARCHGVSEEDAAHATTAAAARFFRLPA